MSKALSLLTLTLFLSQYLHGQEQLPVLKATQAVLSIIDGDELKQEYWSISPQIELDVYTADKSSEAQRVSFCSDIDTMHFMVGPSDVHDFIILLNNTDTCFTQVRSGMKPISTPEIATHDTIPFRLTKFNNISIQTVLNHVDTVNLMFHSGNNVVFINRAIRGRTTSVTMNHVDTINTWGGSALRNYSTNNSLQIAGLSWENVTIGESELSGHETDGKFGWNLFAEKVLEFDFDKSILIIHSSLPNVDERFEKFDLSFRDKSMFVEGISTIGDIEYKNKFMIHTGFGATLLFDDQFVQENKIADQLELLGESQLKDSNGNILKTKRVLLPAIQIGGGTFENVPMELFEGSIAKHKMSIVGGEILKRFNIILDLQQAYIYLSPNSLSDLPFPSLDKS